MSMAGTPNAAWSLTGQGRFGGGSGYTGQPPALAQGALGAPINGMTPQNQWGQGMQNVMGGLLSTSLANTQTGYQPQIGGPLPPPIQGGAQYRSNQNQIPGATPMAQRQDRRGESFSGIPAGFDNPSWLAEFAGPRFGNINTRRQVMGLAPLTLQEYMAQEPTRYNADLVAIQHGNLFTPMREGSAVYNWSGRKNEGKQTGGGLLSL